MAGKLWLTTSAAVLLWAGAAHAQTAPSNDEQASTLDEVVVTAERRTVEPADHRRRRLRAERRGPAEQGRDSNSRPLQFSVPSMTVQNSGQGNSFNIRGIGKTENNSSIGVGVITYRDGVAVFPAYFQNEPFYDIASLEAAARSAGHLRRPERHGRRGLHHRAQPRPQRPRRLRHRPVRQLRRHALSRARSTCRSPTPWRPLRRSTTKPATASTTSSARLRAATRASWIRNSVRASLLWQPNDRRRGPAEDGLHLHRLGGYPTNPIFSTRAAPHDRHQRPVRGPGRVVPHRAERQLRLRQRHHPALDHAAPVRHDLFPIGRRTARPPWPFTFYDKVEQRLWSQEFTLVSPDTDRLTWILGAYYQDDLITFPPGQFVTTQYGSATLPILYDTLLEGDNPKTTAAVFGQITYDLTDAAGAAGRRPLHALDGREPRQTSRAAAGPDPDAERPGRRERRHRQDHPELDAGRRQLPLWLRRSRSQGGRSERPEPGLRRAQALRRRRRHDFEAGWKSTLFDGHLRTQLGAYYNVYQNFQINIGDPTTPVDHLDPERHRRHDHLRSGSLGPGSVRRPGVRRAACRCRTRSSASSSPPTRAAPAPASATRTAVRPAATASTLEGNAQTFAPELTFSARASSTPSTGGAGTLTPRVDYSHISDSWTSIFANAALGDRLKERDIVNAQLTYRAGRLATAGLFHQPERPRLHRLGEVGPALRWRAPPVRHPPDPQLLGQSVPVTASPSGSMQAYGLTVDRFLDHAAKWHGQVPVVTAGQGEDAVIGYAALHDRAERLSGAFLDMDLKMGASSPATGWRPWPGTPSTMSRSGTGPWASASSATP